jgi:DNA modification methylase
LIYLGDCLEQMNNISDGSVDMVLCDLPYGTTRNNWDSVIDLPSLWKQYTRVCKPNAAILLFAQTPFDKVLGCSNLPDLRYEWVWEKTTATGHLNAKKMPMKAHENVLVFYRSLPVYNPQKTAGHSPVHAYTKHQDDGSNYGRTNVGVSGGGSTERYPRSVLLFPTDKQKEALHPTQKPVNLGRYFIRTYSNIGDTVLDNAFGSGTFLVSAFLEGRKYIGIEKEKEFFDIAEERLRRIATAST